MNKIVTAAVAAILLLLPVQAVKAQMNTSLYIREIEYKKNKVEIEFADNTLKDLTLRWTDKELLNVFDKSGARVPAEIMEKSEDRLRFYLPKAAENGIYTFELSRVSYGGRNDIVYTGFFVTTPNWTIEYKTPPRFRKQAAAGESSAEDVFIRDLEYDRGGRLEIKFAAVRGKAIHLEWSGGERVVVKDETGTAYETFIEEYGKNKIELRILDIVENMNYVITISNIDYNSEKLSFQTVFTARDDWRYRPPRLRR